MAAPIDTSRAEAIEWIAMRIGEGRCGLDPHDRELLLLDVHYTVNQAGQMLAGRLGDVVDCRVHTSPEGLLNARIAFRPDPRVLEILSLARPDMPVMDDEPLASRGAPGQVIPLPDPGPGEQRSLTTAHATRRSRT